MAAHIRDLRELVCVSRLTVRHSDDEFFSSDEDESLSRQLSELGLKDSSHDAFDVAQSDSGIGTANTSPQESYQANGSQNSPAFTVKQAGLKLREADSHATPRSYQKKKRKKKQSNYSAMLATGHEFPRQTPLPPVGSASSHRSEDRGLSQRSEDKGLSERSEDSTSSQRNVGSASSQRNMSSTCYQRTMVRQTSSGSSTRSVTPQAEALARKKEGDFDELLSYLDATVVSEWLQTCNASVADMATWCHAGENFVKFAHFWLSDFPSSQKMDILKLEYGIVVDNIRFAFSVGLDSGQLKWKDISQFLAAVFREYPVKILSTGGSDLFLDYLHVLTSEKQDEYRTILSNVKCSTRNRQYAQLVLAVRSFALVNIWYGITNFYREIASTRTEALHQPIPIAEVNKKDPHVHRLYHALRLGFLDVVFYLIKTRKVSSQIKDAHNRNLVFISVMNNQPKLLQFFLKHCKPSPDLNEAADTGNTALHAAANSGHAEVLRLLLSHPHITVDAANSQCGDATPLHLAVMHGHTEAVSALLKAGADTSLQMGSQSPLEVATEFEHQEIVDLIKQHLEEKSSGEGQE